MINVDPDGAVFPLLEKRRPEDFHLRSKVNSNEAFLYMLEVNNHAIKAYLTKLSAHTMEFPQIDVICSGPLALNCQMIYAGRSMRIARFTIEVVLDCHNLMKSKEN